jgi:gliding motility-associated-like protein
LPQTVIVNNPDTICLGDTIYLQATGGVEYTWSPTDRILSDNEGNLFTRLMSPGSFTVRVVNEFGCVDSTSVTYSNIEPCCQYSYPNAFTPNGDGKNDGFKVITYGNSWSYKLAIYNRWGQLVFLSYDPAQYWDGTQYGKPCDAGTYFYFFNGRCVTGGTDEHQGDVTLIR